MPKFAYTKVSYFDSTLPFQLSSINHRSTQRKYKVNIPPQDDEYNSVREEFTEMLKRQIAKSNNGIPSVFCADFTDPKREKRTGLKKALSGFYANTFVDHEMATTILYDHIGTLL